VNQSFKLLKPGARLGLVSPMLLTAQKQKLGVPLLDFANSVGFKPIQLLNSQRFSEKKKSRFKLNRYIHKSIFDSGTERITREFHLFQKPYKSNK
jgi:hypothetical protein